MPAPQISPLPTPPSRSQSPETFSVDADAFLGAFPDFQSEANDQADYLDALAIAVDADATIASNSAAIAAGAANYQGDYSAGTTYQIGESVSYTGRRYVAKTVNTGVTPADGANWFLINDGDVLGPVSATNNGIALYDGTTGKIIKSGLNNGTAGQALISGGSGNAPTWGSVEGGVLPFTASGSITAGNPVCLRSDGAVEVATGFSQTETIGAAANYSSQSGSARDIFDIPATSNFILFNSVGSTRNVTIGTISGNTITYGTPVTCPWNGGPDPEYIRCAFDPVSGKFFVTWLQTSGTYPDVFGAVLTVTGTTPSWGAAGAVFASQTSLNANGHAVVYDSLRQKIVVCSSGGDVNSGQQQIWLHSINISGTSFTVGYSSGPFVLSSGGFTTFNAAYDVAVQRIIVCTGNTATNNSLFLFSNSGSAFASVGTGTLNFNMGRGGLVYDSANSRYIAVGRDGVTQNLASCTFTVSASSFTVGATLIIPTGSTTITNEYRTPAAYDVRSGQIFIATYTQLNQVFYGLLSVSESTLSISKAFSSISTSTRSPVAYYSNTAQKTVLGYYSDGGAVGVNQVFIPAASATNTQNFIGISTQSVSNGQTVNVTITGGRNTNLSGLTTGANYFLNNDGALVTTGGVRVGEALSATSILVEGKLAGAGTPSASTFLRGDGVWAGPSPVLLASGTLASASASIIVNDLPQTYSHIIVDLYNISPTQSSVNLFLNWVGLNGSSAIANHNAGYVVVQSAGSITTAFEAATTNVIVSPFVLSFGASEIDRSALAARLIMFSYSGTGRKPFTMHSFGTTTYDTGSSSSKNGGGYVHTSAPVGGFKLSMSAGSIGAGTGYRVYGVI